MKKHAACSRRYAMRSRLRDLFVGTQGATAIEYGLIVALIALAISAALFTLGFDIAGVFTALEPYFSGTSETPATDNTAPSAPTDPDGPPVRLTRPGTTG